jgi:CRISPR system Cascade subunit CasE
MNMSKLILNPQSRQVQAELSNTYEMHRTLSSAFSPELYEKERFLYRLEIRHTEPYLVILLQSRLLPDWTVLERKGYLLHPAQVKTYEPKFQTGQVLMFRLVANPARRIKPEGKQKLGKRVGLYQFQDQQAWLERKAKQHGFVPLSVQITDLSDQHAYKVIKEERKRLTHHGVRFDGMLEIAEADLFTQAIAQGVGPAKGFGFGLLSLARP